MSKTDYKVKITILSLHSFYTCAELEIKEDSKDSISFCGRLQLILSLWEVNFPFGKAFSV